MEELFTPSEEDFPQHDRDVDRKKSNRWFRRRSEPFTVHKTGPYSALAGPVQEHSQEKTWGVPDN
ncbi:hypothetical protein J6590_059690 [Homalodisca vitripennis]|nr:hypothetical protein J6590_059690 [Homalodisca vitripennis]